jgi:hypothetical protein
MLRIEPGTTWTEACTAAEAKRVYELLCLYEEKQTWEQYLARITEISEKLPSK